MKWCLASNYAIHKAAGSYGLFVGEGAVLGHMLKDIDEQRPTSDCWRELSRDARPVKHIYRASDFFENSS